MGPDALSSGDDATRGHVVLIHRYFYPDTPAYASILQGIALAVGGAGHRVTVLTCQPSYNRAVVARAAARESLSANVTVRRFKVFDDRRSTPLKVINLVRFGAQILLSARKLGDVNVVMAASTPPIGIARIGSILARWKGAAFVYHHQDIYPEVLRLGAQSSIPSRLLRAVDKRTDRAADAIIVLSNDMARTVSRRGVSSSRIYVINNFDPWQLPEQGQLTLRPPDQDAGLNVVYAGNLGRFQGLSAVFDALVELRDEPINFHFIGDGPLRSRLQDLVVAQQLDRVHLHGYRPPADVSDFLRRHADVGLVPLRPGVVVAAYPSKTMSYLRNRVPVLTVVEPDSQLADDLRRHRAGWVADPADSSSMSSTLRRLASSREQLDGAGDRAFQYYEDQFSEKVARDKWIQVFDRLMDARS